MTAPGRGTGLRRLRVWALRGLAGVAAIAVLAAGGVWAKARVDLRHRWTPAPTTLSIAPDPARAAEGARLYAVFGCNGCHGEAGRILFEQPGIGRLVAPNLSARMAAYDDQALVTLIRRGVRPDGTSLIGMPTGALDEMSDRDVADLIAYLRSLPPRADAVAEAGFWGPLGLAAIAAGAVPFSAAEVDAAVAPVERPADAGAYLARTVCTACHALDESRDDGFGLVTPALRDVVPAYDRATFTHLLRTGEPIGGRDLRLMRTAVADGLRDLSDPEIAAILAYLAGD